MFFTTESFCLSQRTDHNMASRLRVSFHAERQHNFQTLPSNEDHDSEMTFKRLLNSPGNFAVKLNSSFVRGWRNLSLSACKNCRFSFAISDRILALGTVLSRPEPYVSSPTTGCRSQARWTRI